MSSISPGNITFRATVALAANTATNVKAALVTAGYTGTAGAKELTITNPGPLSLYIGGADPTTGFPLESGTSDTTRSSGPSDLIQMSAIWVQAAGIQNVSFEVRGA